MVRPSRPEIRRALVERAAGMLARREPLTLRSLVAGTDVSTMAVYTYFDGMAGLLQAVRQEGFGRLGSLLDTLQETDDPVGDMAAAGGAYLRVAREEPALYVLMFDGDLPLEDTAAADATLGHLVAAARRAITARRFSADLDPVAFSRQLWMFGHGACMLLATGVIAPEPLEATVEDGLARLYIGAGDDPSAARRSVASGWSRGRGPRGDSGDGSDPDLA